MPLNFQRDDSLRLVIVVGIGKVQIDEWAAMVARQLDEGIWHYGTLFDFTSVDEVVGFERRDMMSAITEISEGHGTRGPVAFVATTPAVYDRFADYVATQPLPHQARPFRDVNQAVVWLEQELSKPRQV